MDIYGDSEGAGDTACGQVHMRPARNSLCGIDRRILMIDTVEDAEVAKRVCTPMQISDHELGESAAHLDCVDVIIARSQLAAMFHPDATEQIGMVTARQIRHMIVDHERDWFAPSKEKQFGRFIAGKLREALVHSARDFMPSLDPQDRPVKVALQDVNAASRR